MTMGAEGPAGNARGKTKSVPMANAVNPIAPTRRVEMTAVEGPAANAMKGWSAEMEMHAQNQPASPIAQEKHAETMAAVNCAGSAMQAPLAKPETAKRSAFRSAPTSNAETTDAETPVESAKSASPVKPEHVLHAQPIAPGRSAEMMGAAARAANARGTSPALKE